MDEPRRPALRVRSDLLDMSPYVSPQQPARYRMNTNESPYAPPEALVDAVAEGLREASLNRYPDRDATLLHRELAAFLDWPMEGLWVANGSNEVFLHLFLAFGGPGRSALTFEPTYSLHTLIPKVASTRVVQLKRDEEFEIDLDDALRMLREQRPEIVIVCSPNNPTGNCEPLDTVRALAEETDGIVVVDEAYIEFASPNESVRPLLSEYPNLVLTRTFSKAWRLAGVRIGYMLGDPSLIAELARVRLPYHLSAPTQIMGRAVLTHTGETDRLARLIAEERDRISLELQAIGVRSFPSRANFVLFEVDDPTEVWQQLLDRGVLVRNYGGMPGLERCLRVTATVPEESRAFLEAVREVVCD